MFFHPSIYHYAPSLIRFWLSFGAGKKAGTHDGIFYGFPAPPYCDFWCCGILCGVGNRIWFDVKIEPRPDYRLYLTPKYVETCARFQTISAQSQ